MSVGFWSLCVVIAGEPKQEIYRQIRSIEITMNETPLTKNERLTILLSCIGLFFSIASPFMTFYLLQNSEREQNLKAAGFRSEGVCTANFQEKGKPKVSCYVRLEN